MKYVYIALMLAFFSIFSCSKEERLCACLPPPHPEYLNATVIDTSDVSCHAIVVQFDSDAINIVRNITGKTDDKYIVLPLPTQLKVLNKRIKLRVMQLPPAEDFPCNTLGISYPRLKILEASAL